MNEQEFQRLIDHHHQTIQEDRRTASQVQNRIVSQMITTARRETDRLEHHLLEMPLSVIIYQWVIVRLKSRPWRLLIPASLLLSVILQNILSRINVIQFLAH